nr:ethanolamine-phosphate cytidylyltransferase [Quercus suber]
MALHASREIMPSALYSFFLSSTTDSAQSTPYRSSIRKPARMAPKVDPETGCVIPETGAWPVAPQEAVAILEDRLWIDGCFDFFHHGHAGVMLQSRRLGNELLVGLHSDEEIAHNKGPTVMNLAERIAAVEACRFSTLCVPYAPYVTSIPWISHYGCQYVTHGDDITSDANGNDCYRFVKKAGRMKIVPRTPGISTTDLVGRMLLCTKSHFIHSLTDALEGRENKGSEEERAVKGKEMMRLFREYAAAPNGRDPYVDVFTFKSKHRPLERRRSSVKSPSEQGSPLNRDTGKGTFTPLVSGVGPRTGQRIVYVDGGFDLFSSGHIAFLQTVTNLETQLGEDRGWFTPAARQQRLQESGEDYGPAYVVAGVHDDEVINFHKGINYPIMNIFERGLCVVQCQYIHAVVFGAPYTPTAAFLSALPAASQTQLPDAVYHGPTSFMPSAFTADPYADAKSAGVFIETPPHAFQDVNSAQIVQRILDNRIQYEERQRKKGVKNVGEEAQRAREKMKLEQKAMLQRRQSEIERQFGA